MYRVDTVDRLVESTRELLWERGYVGTSPKAIQQHSGAGQGSMYHHFGGKAELALAAIQRTAAELRALAETALGGGGTAYERIEAYLLRERDVLRGCPVGRLTQDPEIVARPELRRPVDETFDWLRGRLAEVVADGQRAGELDAGLDPARVGAAIVAALQGGYVLARAAGDPQPFDDAIRGVLQLLETTRR